MRRWSLVLGLAVSLAAAGDVLDAAYGPRVTIDRRDVKITDLLEELGRLINRRLEPSGSPGLFARTASLKLDDATVGEALGALDEQLNLQAVRRSRGRYVVAARRELPGYLGQPLGDWAVWLQSVQYSLTSTLNPADPDRAYTRAVVMPRFLVEAPSDQDAARIQRVTLPEVVSPEQRRTFGINDVTAPEPSDPRFWRVQMPLPPPPIDQEFLDSAEFNLHLAGELRPLRLEFDDLDSEEALTQTDGETDVRLEAPGTRRNVGWRISVYSTAPDGADEQQREAQRPGPWTEFQLLDADGRTIYSDARYEGAQVHDDRLVRRHWLAPLEDSDDHPVARIIVTVYLPVGAEEIVPVTFEQIPMPDRRQP